MGYKRIYPILRRSWSQTYENEKEVLVRHSLPIWVVPCNIKMGLMGREDVDWILQAEGKDQWRALVNTVMKLWTP